MLLINSIAMNETNAELGATVIRIPHSAFRNLNSRLLVDAPAAGAWNMAVDEALLELAAENLTTTLRFYRWQEPTLSLGYFQPSAQRIEHPPSAGCPLVRRSSGGGAIVHDAELTYCLSMPAGNLPAGGARGLYGVVHRSLVAALAELGVRAVLQCDAGPIIADAEEDAFLCFLRRSPADVLVEGVKIAGSAQRRRRGAVLQHGSVLLGRSAAAPELEGAEEVAGVEISFEDLTDAWKRTLTGKLLPGLEPGELTELEQDRATQLLTGKHTCARWLRRR